MENLPVTDVYAELRERRAELAALNQEIKNTEAKLSELVEARNRLGKYVNQILRQISTEPETKRGPNKIWNRDAEFPRTDTAIGA